MDAETVPPDEAFDFFNGSSPVTSVPPEDAGTIIDGEIVEDKSTTKTSGKRSRLTSGDPGVSLDKPASAGIPKIDDWQDFWSRIIIRLGTDYYLHLAFGDIDEDLLSDREISRIRLAPDERDRIARPFAELSNKLKWTRKHGRLIISSAGTIDSAIQLGMWISRVNRIARKYKAITGRPGQRTGVRTVLRTARPQPQSAEMQTDRGEANGNVSSGQGTEPGPFNFGDHYRPDIGGDIINPDLG